jgi:hypothetical protein
MRQVRALDVVMGGTTGRSATTGSAPTRAVGRAEEDAEDTDAGAGPRLWPDAPERPGYSDGKGRGKRQREGEGGQARVDGQARAPRGTFEGEEGQAKERRGPGAEWRGLSQHLARMDVPLSAVAAQVSPDDLTTRIEALGFGLDSKQQLIAGLRICFCWLPAQ